MRTPVRPKISLCMIVKNEERFLAHCLAAARPLVDEICIVDTGSTDRTESIAHSFGAEVRRIEWPKSFAKARNVSLDMAHGEWILFLDADEVIRGETARGLRELCDNPRLIGAHFRFVNHYDERKKIECLIMRFFRNAPQHRFTGAIHEQVLPSVLETGVKTGQVVLETTIVVDHYGYSDAVRAEKSKDERNRTLFLDALAEEPDNAYLWFKYADFLRRFDDADAIIAAFEETCRILENREPTWQRVQTFGAEAYALLALEMIKKDRLDRAENLLTYAAIRFDVTATFLWVQGQLYLRRERWAEAEACFAACRAFDGRVQHVPAQPGITGGRALFGIARAKLGRGAAAEAETLFVDGAEKYPECRDLVLAAAQTAANRGDVRSSIERTMKWLDKNPKDAEFWELGAFLFWEIGMDDKAETWAKRAIDDGSDRPMARAVLGEIAILGRDYRRAAELFAGGHDLRHRAGHSIACLLGGGRNSSTVADPDLRSARSKLLARLSKRAAFAGLLDRIMSEPGVAGALLAELEFLLNTPTSPSAA